MLRTLSQGRRFKDSLLWLLLDQGACPKKLMFGITLPSTVCNATQHCCIKGSWSDLESGRSMSPQPSSCSSHERRPVNQMSQTTLCMKDNSCQGTSQTQNNSSYIAAWASLIGEWPASVLDTKGQAPNDCFQSGAVAHADLPAGMQPPGVSLCMHVQDHEAPI